MDIKCDINQDFQMLTSALNVSVMLWVCESFESFSKNNFHSMSEWKW